jgi:hypothetical protein
MSSRRGHGKFTSFLFDTFLKVRHFESDGVLLRADPLFFKGCLTMLSPAQIIHQRAVEF